MSAIANPAVQEVRGYIRELSADEKERQRAEARMKAIRDEASLLEDAEKRGLEKGRQEGISIGEARGEVKGEAKLLQRLIEKRYQQFPAWVQDKLNAATTDQLEAWADRIFTAETLEALLAD